MSTDAGLVVIRPSINTSQTALKQHAMPPRHAPATLRGRRVRVTHKVDSPKLQALSPVNVCPLKVAQSIPVILEKKTHVNTEFLHNWIIQSLMAGASEEIKKLKAANAAVTENTQREIIRNLMIKMIDSTLMSKVRCDAINDRFVMISAMTIDEVQKLYDPIYVNKKNRPFLEVLLSEIKKMFCVITPLDPKSFIADIWKKYVEKQISIDDFIKQYDQFRGDEKRTVFVNILLQEKMENVLRFWDEAEPHINKNQNIKVILHEYNQNELERDLLAGKGFTTE